MCAEDLSQTLQCLFISQARKHSPFSMSIFTLVLSWMLSVSKSRNYWTLFPWIGLKGGVTLGQLYLWSQIQWQVLSCCNFATYNSVFLHSELVDRDLSLCLCVFVTQLGDEVCAPTLGTATSMYKFNRWIGSGIDAVYLCFGRMEILISSFNIGVELQTLLEVEVKILLCLLLLNMSLFSLSDYRGPPKLC